MTLTKRMLGRSQLEVSCLGLGTVKIGRNQGVKYPAGFALPSDNEVANLLDLARDLGINLLDTAPAYGSSEQRIGRLLRNRQDWVICTKVGEEFLNGKSFFDFSAQHVRRSIERSLRDLNTDYLDIVLVHSDGHDMRILESSECLPTLFDMKEKGVIRAVGMSTKTIDGGLRALDLTDAVMVTYNPANTAEGVVIDAAILQDKGVLIKKALDSGHACEGENNSTASNLQFAIERDGVSSVIVGTINPNHLMENARSITKQSECAR